MTRKDFEAFTMKHTKRRHQLMFGTRGPDYASDADCLANFKKRSVSMNHSAKIVCLNDISKHMQQVIDHFSLGLPAKGEGLQGRIDDMQNYLDLLRALAEE